MEIFLFCLISIPLYRIFFNITELSRQSKNKLFFILAVSQLFLISALRADCVGGDLVNYIPRFRLVHTLEFKDIFGIWEPGFMIFMKFISIISSTPRFFLFSTSLLIYILFARYLYKNSPYVWVSILIFIIFGFYSNTMNIIRHSIALMITLNSIEDIVNKDLKKFVIKVLIAASFQVTALVFFPAYLCSNFKFSFYRYICAILGVIIISKMGIIVSVMQFFLSVFMPKLEEVVDFISSSGGGYMLALTMVIITSLLWLVYRCVKCKVNDTNKNKINVYFNLQLCAIMIQLLFAPLVSVSTRLTAFYLCPLIVLVPLVIQCICNKNYKILAFCGVLSIIVVLYMATGGYVDGTNSDLTLPYYFYWDVALKN